MTHAEKGIGILTLVIIIAVSAMIAAGAGMTTIQMFRGTELNADISEAVQQAHSLGRWFCRDAMTAANISAGDDPGTTEAELATLYWNDWETGDYGYVRYVWLDDADSLKKITRKEIRYDSGDGVTDSIANLVAYGIYTANLTLTGDTWNLGVEARSGEKSSVQSYAVTRRLN